jgi:hypothetical protein
MQRPGYWAESWGIAVRLQAEFRNLFVQQCPDRLWGPPSLLIRGCWGLSNYEADHLPTSSADVKNEWFYTPTPPYVFVACAGRTLLSLLPEKKTIYFLPK